MREDPAVPAVPTPRRTTRTLATLRRCPLLLAGVLAVLALDPVGAAGAGRIPGQGEQVRVGTPVTGACQPDTPAYPDTSTWGADEDGTPYNGTSIYTEFFFVQADGQPVSAGSVDSVGWSRGDTIQAFADADGVERCRFASDSTGLIDAWPVHVRGIWMMRTHTVTSAKTFDSVSGWVPAAGDGRDDVKETRFEVVDTNHCRNSAWVGIGPTDPECLKQKEKLEAQQAAHDYEAAHARDQEAYKGLGCGPGASNVDGNETKFACAAATVKNAFDAQMASHEQQLAHDPPAPYASIARPAPVRAAGLARLPRAWASTASMLRHLGRAAAVHGALATTINRANGAFAATPADPAADAWTLRQNSAAERYVAQARDQLAAVSRQLPAARRRLLSAGIRPRIVALLFGGETQAVKASATLMDQLAAS